MTPHVPVPHGVMSTPPRINPNGPEPAQNQGPLPAISRSSGAPSAAASAAGRVRSGATPGSNSSLRWLWSVSVPVVALPFSSVAVKVHGPPSFGKRSVYTLLQRVSLMM